MSSWTKEKTLLLIEKIRESNVWDVKSKVYKDAKVRGDIFEEIGQRLNLTRKEIEDKWHNIKSQFSRELSKVKASQKSGAGTDEIYVPSWYAFKTLLFLKEHYEPVISRSSDTQGNILQCQDEAIELEDLNEHSDNPSTETQTEENSNAPLTTSHTPRTSNASLKSGWKRKCEDPDMKDAVNCMKIVGNNLIKKTRDNFDILGEHVASELRMLKDPKYRFILAKTKQTIYNALSDAEMSRLQVDNNITRPSTATSVYSDTSVGTAASGDEATTVTTLTTLGNCDTYNVNDNSLASYFSSYNN